MRLILAIPLLFALGTQAQRDVSLTPEFAGLSAKERARIAKSEQDDAPKDERFQALMGEGEALFQQQRFEEALWKYKEARSVRPYNVYPKVKIQDLEAMLAKRAAEAQVSQQVEPPGPEATEVRKQEVVPADTVIDAPAHSAAPSGSIKPVAPLPTVRTKAVARGSDPPEPVKEPTPDGLTERSFLEGRAVVLERRLVQNGVESVHRKVTHPWGQVVHFRDGIAISEREWNETFRGQ